MRPARRQLPRRPILKVPGQIIVSETHGAHRRLTAYKLESAHAWDEEWSAYSVAAVHDVKDYYFRFPVLYPTLLRHLPRPGEVLEAGSGLGHWVSLLHEAGFPVRGIDSSEEALVRSREAFPGLPFDHGDATALPYADGRFAGYFSFGLAEHFAEGPEVVLREAARVLKDGGVLIASVPWLSPLRRCQPFRLTERPPASRFYQYFFTRRELRAAVEACGFEVLGTDAYGPLKALRDEWRVVRERLGARRNGKGVPSPVPLPPATAPVAARAAPPSPPRAPSAAWRAARRRAYNLLLENPPLRAVAGHMTLVVARRRPRR
jgi:SAM-dependent methyltransferase